MSAHPPILLGTLGMSDSLILMVMALVVFGPRRLPQIGRQIGKLMYEFRKASNDFKFQMEEELRNSEEADRRKKEEERLRSLASVTAAEQASVSADPPLPAKTVESSSPGEETYPPQYPPQVAPGENRAEESAPRIMPPSVGETVAAAKPSRGTNPELQTTGGTTASDETTVAGGATQNVNQSSETAEALNQHG